MCAAFTQAEGRARRSPVSPNNSRQDAMVAFFFYNHREVKDPRRPYCCSHRGHVALRGDFKRGRKGVMFMTRG